MTSVTGGIGDVNCVLRGGLKELEFFFMAFAMKGGGSRVQLRFFQKCFFSSKTI